MKERVYWGNWAPGGLISSYWLVGVSGLVKALPLAPVSVRVPQLQL